MSKIICDVCGTSFPDTTEQCPICGCVRSADAKVIAGDHRDSEQGTNSTYTHVRGGRFSKANVKKRNASKQDPKDIEKNDHEGNKSDKTLVIVAIVLLLAIIAVCVYFFIRFGDLFASANKDAEPSTKTPVVDVKPEDDVNQQDDEQQEDPDDTSFPCTLLDIVTKELLFDAEGQTKSVSFVVEPANTTDVVSFAVADSSVATVDENGSVTAVADGETVVTVTCGEFTGECVIKCEFEEEEEIPEEPVDVFSAESNGNVLVDDQTYKLNTYMGLRDCTVPANSFHEFTLKNSDGESLDFEIVEESAYCSVDGHTIHVNADAPSGGIVTIFLVYGENAGDYIECILRF